MNVLMNFSSVFGIVRWHGRTLQLFKPSLAGSLTTCPETQQAARLRALDPPFIEQRIRRQELAENPHNSLACTGGAKEAALDMGQAVYE